MSELIVLCKGNLEKRPGGPFLQPAGGRGSDTDSYLQARTPLGYGLIGESLLNHDGIKRTSQRNRNENTMDIHENAMINQ